MDKYSTSTDQTGKAHFVLTSPLDLANAVDVNMTAGILNGNPVRELNISVRYDKAEYNLTTENNITVGKTGTDYTIAVGLAKKQVGSTTWEPAVGKIIVAEYLMPVYGSLASYEAVVGDNGQALFTYTSPKRGLDINNTNITFHMKENYGESNTTTLLFKPEAVEEVAKVMVVPGSMKITQGSEERNITIITVNAANVGISAKVNVEELYDGSDDYGTFTPSGTIKTDDAGHANIIYTAPVSISGLTERNITITETS